MKASQSNSTKKNFTESDFMEMMDTITFLFDKWVGSDDLDGTDKKLRKEVVENKNKIFYVLKKSKGKV